MILRKKIKSELRRLKQMMAFNCKAVRDQSDALTFMSELKKRIDDLLYDTDTFILSIHKKNPF